MSGLSTTHHPEPSPATRFRARLAGSGSARIVVCDLSASMNLSAGGSLRRIDHLARALDQILTPGGHVVIAFNSIAWEIKSAAECANLMPSGGTALELALHLATEKTPRSTLVISDGEPDSPEAALEAAESLSGTIDVIYCGDDGNRTAIGFMRKLARIGCGRFKTYAFTPGAPELGATMRLLLAGPSD